MKKILVTGGAGYIGSILVPELLKENFKVKVIDNFMYRQNSLASACSHPNFDLINTDVRNFDLMLPHIKEADIIIPLAAYVGAPLCSKDPVGATTTNRDAIFKMFASISKDQWILMPTTNSAYGSGDQNHYCDEKSSLSPLSLYAKDKVEVEKKLMERENSISFRLATVFGMSPRMRIDLLVNDFTYRALNDRFIVLFESHFKRNYLHIKDVAQVFLHGIKNFSKMKGQIYNAGLSNANLSKLELCKLIKEYVPNFAIIEAPIGKDPDQRNYIVSNQKIEATGFQPLYSVDFGIQELIKGYQMIKNTRYGNV